MINNIRRKKNKNNNMRNPWKKRNSRYQQYPMILINPFKAKKTDQNKNYLAQVSETLFGWVYKLQKWKNIS